MEANAAVTHAKGRLARRVVILATMALMALTALPTPVAADETTPVPTATEAQRVINIAMTKIGSRWSFASTGPTTFDCSGLVTFAFREAGLLDRIGGKRRTAGGYYKWFKAQGLADRVVGQPGDLIVWGRDTHVGIYLGNGMAISTLINPHGVRIHPVAGYLGMPVKAFLHVNLAR